jgi:hypothetical protein
MAVVCRTCGKVGRCGSGEVEEIPGYGVLCYDCFNAIQQRLRYSREEISRAVAMVRKVVKT